MLYTLALAMVLPVLVAAQLRPGHFSLSKAFFDSTLSYFVDTTSYSGLAGNSILDIQPGGDSLMFLGTSRGLTVSPDLGETYRSYIASDVDLPRGGISALLVADSLVITAALVDTQTSVGWQKKGTGLSYSTDLGHTWVHKEQDVEAENSDDYVNISWGDSTIRQLAVTTAISNVTFHVAYSLGAIWTTSWAGGLRRYHIATGEWSVVPLPGDGDTTLACDDIPAGYEVNPLDPVDGGNHNHKGFSVIAYDSLVWVGTVAGINKGIVDSASGCISWTHYTSRWNGLSGNWVLALYRQTAPGLDRIWASTHNAEDPLEQRGVSYTEDNGRTWKTTLLGERVDNFASNGDTIYAAASSGLYKSIDGRNWARFKSAVDAESGEQVWAEDVYGVQYDQRNSMLWLATPDGLARTSAKSGEEGIAWEIKRAFVSTQTAGEERFYAYPNPFYLAEHNVRDGAGHVRLQYHITELETGVKGTVVIFDFALQKVRELPARAHSIAGDYSQVWDGRNSSGFEVANGVYYCRLTIGAKDFWTKVIVIK